jgi:hypothetical protein
MIRSLVVCWTDFLTTDGEEHDRDAELTDPPQPREALMQIWEQGWQSQPEIKSAVGHLAAVTPPWQPPPYEPRAKAHQEKRASPQIRMVKPRYRPRNPTPG